MAELVTELPLPRRSEAWKYTDTARLLQGLPGLRPEAGPAPADGASLFAAENRLFFVDGRWLPEASCGDVQPRSGAPAEIDDGLDPLRERAVRHSYQLELTDAPLHLLLLASSDSPRLSALDLAVRVPAGVRSQLIIEQAGGQDGSLSLLRLEGRLERGAALDLVRCQHLTAGHNLLGSQEFDVRQDARLRQVHVEWGARLSRLASRLRLTAAGADLEYHALSGLSGRQHCDHQVEVRHEAEQGRSRLRARGLVDDRARQVFNGKVHVARGAQHTDSDQLLRNLLLSDKAEVDAKPELEIYADDVRCAHGSTVGRLDDTALFYLRSRGLDESQARRLLMLSFAEAVLGEIRDDGMRDIVREHFSAHLALGDSA